MNMSLASKSASLRSALPVHPWTLVPLTVALIAGGLGCFRATGIARPSVAVEEIPTVGGDRVVGLKATGGPGDFFIGNDSVEMAVDGAPFGDREGQFGAPSGGAILDVGAIALDQSYHRVAMPTDMLERLGPVANQDPDLPLVFDRYLPGTAVDSVYLQMEGYLLDAKGKLGVATDPQSRVSGVTVTHRISLGKGHTFFTLETTLTNQGTTTLPIRNIGDFLSQHGGGFRFVVPAVSTFSGAPLNTWGVEIPGSDFSAPLTTSVLAPMVGLMGSESAGNTLDSHASMGILPLDVEGALVTSDPQAALTEARPRFPERLVVGSPAVADLPPGQSIQYRRRLYNVGGPSYSGIFPAQATFILSEMTQARAGFRGEDVGFLRYSASGTAARGGPLQTEFKFERYTYAGTVPFDLSDPSNPANQPGNWRLERVEWQEPIDIGSSNLAVGMWLPAFANGASGENQRYRLSARNALAPSTPFVLYQGTNLLNKNSLVLRTDITPSKAQPWEVAEALIPERNEVVDAAGNLIRSKQTSHLFSARQAGTLENRGLNPLRLTFLGLGVPDPSVQRTRQMSSVYSQIYKAKTGVGINYGAYQYSAGNQIFGTGFGPNTSTALMWFAPGDYLAYATRGPMSRLDSLPIKAFDGQDNRSHGFVVTPPTLPTGWTTFDLPSPTQATTGGFNPGELLSSAVAEGVQVVARTEDDLQTDPTALRTEFRAEIDIPAVSDAQRAPLGADPFVVGARSSTLTDGFTTALFIPTPTTDRNGGARPSKGWNLADFITQAEGQYTIVHQPRGPKGLFTVRGFDPLVPIGTGANAWWNQTGAASLGKRLGDFDALELLRAEGCNPLDPTAWYAEYTQVRTDWFALLNQQAPATFTKALGLSAARYSLDTPVGLARTYLKVDATLTQAALGPVLTALKSGAAVASTGPMLDVSVNGTGPGGLVTTGTGSVELVINLYAPDWVPVDEVRVVVNGSAAPIGVPLSAFVASTTDSRLRTATVTIPLPAGKDAWLVVEAGVPRAQTGPYLPGTPWNKIMKGIYPIAITNPIFVDANGGGYTPPGL